MQRRTILGLAATGALVGLTRPSRAAEGAWPEVRARLFGDHELRDGSELLWLDAPGRAHDAAIVPMTIRSRFDPTPERWVKQLWLVIDENPAPLAGLFRFTPDQGRTFLATRVRVNAYTPVHAVAETSDGVLWVVERFVKAAGGCSAPGLKDQEAAMARLGRMQMKLLGDFTSGSINRAQLLVSHPNSTGMQIDQLSRAWIPANYVQKIDIAFAGQPVLNIEADISLSEDPSLTFGFLPAGPGLMSATVEDSDGRRFEQSWSLGSSA